MKHLTLIFAASLIYSGIQAQVIGKDTVYLKTDTVIQYMSFDSSKIKAEISPKFSIPDSVVTRRLNLNQTNSFVLLAWSAANIIQGSISAGNLTGSQHYFHQMNAYFNTVNLALAGYGLFREHQQRKMQFSLVENIKEQQKISSFLMLNTGLDATYIATGLYLQERGMNHNDDKAKGYGSSLMLQGAFLLVFDIVQYVQHQQNGKLLNQYLGNLQITATPTGVGLVMPL